MPRSRAARITQLAAGIALMIIAPITAPLPGPAATFIFAGGLLLVLRNSSWARFRFARALHDYPRLRSLLDRAMRRNSARRRREREEARR